MPTPPPKSMAPVSTPSSSRMRAAKSTTTRAASSKAAVPKICDPMWEWRPRNRRWGASRILRTTSRACPSATDTPNFWSSWAVAMYSLPPAWTPDFKRTMTGASTPSRAAMRSTAPTSWAESMKILWMPA